MNSISALTEIVTSKTEKETSSAASTTAVSATSVTESATVSETTTSAAITAEPEKQTSDEQSVVRNRNHSLARPLRFHDLRHSCASLLLASGVSMKAIQDWLGHSTFNVTANFYSHLDYQSRISSAEVIASALGGESETEENEDNNKKTGS